MVTPVFHELRRQFNSIPLYPSNTRDQPLVFPGKHMLKCMTKFMEDGLYLRKGKGDKQQLIS